MSEAQAIARVKGDRPATASSLARQLAALGVEAGQVVIVHASLSRLGWVVGGATAVVQALEDVVGPEGTLVMPSHTTALTDPCHWENPPVPESWWQKIRDSLPAFDPRRTPSAHMGAIAELFRTEPGVVRSNHPVGSFTARGPLAEEIVCTHPLEDAFGECSPLGRLYDLGASVLLLGVGHDNNTSLHLAEARARDDWRPQGSPVMKDGVRVWATYNERLHDSEEFPAIAADYKAAGQPIQEGPIGAGQATLTPVMPLIDFAVAWMRDRETKD